MPNHSARLAVYISQEKKAEIAAVVDESGRSLQERLRDALDGALPPPAPAEDEQEIALRLQGALAEIGRLEAHLADTTAARERLEAPLAREQANLNTFAHAL